MKMINIVCCQLSFMHKLTLTSIHSENSCRGREIWAPGSTGRPLSVCVAVVIII